MIEPPVSNPEGPVVKRDVAALDVNVIEDYKPFDAAGLNIVPLPVWHGDDLVSLGFSFSIRGSDGKHTNIVYISDISRMIPETLDYIQNKLPPTDLLIVDALLPEFEHPVHFSLEQAANLSKEVAAKRTYLIGMSCDAFPPHDVMNNQLALEQGTIQFAHDGLVLYL
jgi:phosphoribosyl 1,2-cyclic phosphodiesterase